MDSKFMVYDAFFQPSGRFLSAPDEAALDWNEFLISFQCSIFDNKGRLLLLAPKGASGDRVWELPGGYAPTRESAEASLSSFLTRLFPSVPHLHPEHIRTLNCRSSYRFLFTLCANLPEPALLGTPYDWRYVTESELEALRSQGLLAPYVSLSFSLRTLNALHFKTIYRSAWPRVLSRDFVSTYLPAAPEIRRPAGVVSLFRIGQVTEPCIKFMSGRPYTITDSGYFWFQFAPCQSHVWLTAMYDSSLKLIQYYFDISFQNEVFPDGNAYFFDLFLDLVLLPDGARYILDEDELLAAEAAGQITSEMSALAFSELAKLQTALDGRELRLQKWSLSEARRLLTELP